MGKEAKEEVRIDKWMWSVRLFKTRTMAADACKKGRVMVGGSNVKASKMIRLNDIVQIKRPPITYSFKVLGLTENRMGAKLVPDFMENVTTADQLQILELSKFSNTGKRDRGTGRPTKKERRDLEEYIEPSYGFDDDFLFDFSDDDENE